MFYAKQYEQCGEDDFLWIDAFIDFCNLKEGGGATVSKIQEQMKKPVVDPTDDEKECWEGGRKDKKFPHLKKVVWSNIIFNVQLSQYQILRLLNRRGYEWQEGKAVGKSKAGFDNKEEIEARLQQYYWEYSEIFQMCFEIEGSANSDVKIIALQVCSTNKAQVT